MLTRNDFSVQGEPRQFLSPEFPGAAGKRGLAALTLFRRPSARSPPNSYSMFMWPTEDRRGADDHRQEGFLGRIARAGWVLGALFEIDYKLQNRSGRVGSAVIASSRKSAPLIQSASNSIRCAPCHRANRPSSGNCSAPAMIVRKWLPASWPTLLAKRTLP